MIEGIDHLVLTVRSVEDTCGFYESVLGCTRVDAPGRPTALRFGGQQINVHAASRTFEPKAASPTAGAGDFCLLTRRSIEDVLAHLSACGVTLEVGPVSREGARGPMTSVYVRDPDRNLVEVSRYDTTEERPLFFD